MATPTAPTSSSKVEVHLGEMPSTAKEEEKIYPQIPPRFIPKEGYELIGSLVKVDPTLTKLLIKFLKGADLVPDEDSTTGYRMEKLKDVEPFCNDDGAEKIMNLILLHINTPLSYRDCYISIPRFPIGRKIWATTISCCRDDSKAVYQGYSCKLRKMGYKKPNTYTSNRLFGLPIH